jgi:hypothetical protein
MTLTTALTAYTQLSIFAANKCWSVLSWPKYGEDTCQAVNEAPLPSHFHMSPESHAGTELLFHSFARHISVPVTLLNLSFAILRCH